MFGNADQFLGVINILDFCLWSHLKQFTLHAFISNVCCINQFFRWTLLTMRSRVRFPALPKFKIWIRPGMGSTQSREENWVAT